MTPDPIIVEDLGRRPYGEVLEYMRSLCRRRASGDADDDRLLLVEHEPVVTLGRGTRASSLRFPPDLLKARGLPVFEVERGGDVTLHAPGQLVGYPILDLTRWRTDLHWYLRQLEATLVAALARLGIAADRNPGKTGVWTGSKGAERKIASIGIHVKQWVTMHGFALNVTTDLTLFDLIVPCGIPDVRMTSVARERPDLADPMGRTREGVIGAFGEVFERRCEVRGPRCEVRGRAC